MTLLTVEGLRAGYGASEVLHGIDLAVEEGEVVVVLGANGAGKTTLMRALSGMLPRRGHITVDGRSMVGLRPEQVVARGVRLVPQGRGTFTSLTVRENLLVGAAIRRDADGVRGDIDALSDTFPVLRSRADQLAGTLSGGEQQMLAVSRALMSRPRLLLCDEPSLGLAPLVVQELFARLERLNREQGTAMLIVEQNAELALELGSRAYLLEVGTVVAHGSAAELRSHDAVRRAYLGY